MEILKAYGIPTKIVDAISILYKDTEAQVITPDGDTEFFEILAGVLQGDTLAPFLFIIVLHYPLEKLLEKQYEKDMKGPGSRSWIDLSLLFSFIFKSLKNGSDRLRKGTTAPGASSETQGQSVGSGEKAGRKSSGTDERAPGYRLSPNYSQKFKRMPSPDWAQKMLCIIVPNRRTVPPEFFS